MGWTPSKPPALLLALIHRSAWKGNSANFSYTESSEVRAWRDEHEDRYYISRITLSLLPVVTPLFYARRNMKMWSNRKLVVEPTTIEVSLATLAPISGGKFA